MIRLVTKALFLITAFSFSASTYALQKLEGVDGEVLAGKISIKEPTRIAVAGRKIHKWFFNDGDLTVEKDQDNGQLFVRPNHAIKPINIFVIDNKGRTYTLLLEPADIPAENIIISDKQAKYSEPTGIERSGSYAKVIKNMVLAMATESTPRGVEVREVNKDLLLWREVKFNLDRQYIGKSIVGERFSIKNITDKPLILAEQELFKRGVLAVSIENMNLGTGESTLVYVIREKGENE